MIYLNYENNNNNNNENTNNDEKKANLPLVPPKHGFGCAIASGIKGMMGYNTKLQQEHQQKQPKFVPSLSTHQPKESSSSISPSLHRGTTSAKQMMKSEQDNNAQQQSSPPSIVQTSSSSSSCDVPFTYSSVSVSPKEGLVIGESTLGMEKCAKRKLDDINYDNKLEKGGVDLSAKLAQSQEQVPGFVSSHQQEYENKNNPMAKSSDLQWQKHLADLAEYKSKFGHCNVPFQYTNNKSLGYWVHNQRQVYKKWLKGEPCSLTQSRINSLTSLGFSLKSQRALKKEKMATVSCSEGSPDNNIPTNIQQIQHSSVFAKSDQGINFTKIADECKSNSSQSCQNVFVKKTSNKPSGTGSILESTSYSSTTKPEITVSSSSSSNKAKTGSTEGLLNTFDVLWNRRLGELREFQIKNGHSDVPSIYSANR